MARVKGKASSAASKPPLLAEMIRLAACLDDNRSLFLEMERLIEFLQAAGIVVVGEKSFLDTLHTRLDQARKLLAEPPSETGATDQQVKDLAALLTGMEWELAGELKQDLVQKVEAQKQQRQVDAQSLADLSDDLTEWQDLVRALEDRLPKARAVLAPVKRIEGDILRLRGLVDRGQVAMRDGNLNMLKAQLGQLAEEKERAEQIAAELTRRTEEAARFSQQYDLVLVQSTTEDQSYEYTVLLRNISQADQLAVNLHDTCPFVSHDRTLMSDSINVVTEAINQGLVRQFELRQMDVLAEAAQPAPAPAPANGNEPEELRHSRPVAPGPAPSEDISELTRQIGDLMYRLIIPEHIRAYLKDTRCTITITTNDLELPWELMWYRGNFLCLDRPVARMPIGRALPRDSYALRPKTGAPRFLFIYSDAQNNLPAARREVEQIRQDLRTQWGDQVETEFLDNPSGLTLTKLLPLGKYDVIHFAGHAAFNRSEPDRSGLQLKDEVFQVRKIRQLLEGRPLVFLNACQSGRAANETEPQSVHEYLQKPASGLASAFIYGGAPACIGALWPVYDRPAADFAVSFYSHFLEGFPIGEAMRRSRLASREQYPESITWASFVLYGDPMYRV